VNEVNVPLNSADTGINSLLDNIWDTRVKKRYAYNKKRVVSINKKKL
jgi:hypothetical protein